METFVPTNIRPHNIHQALHAKTGILEKQCICLPIIERKFTVVIVP